MFCFFQNTHKTCIFTLYFISIPSLPGTGSQGTPFNMRTLIPLPPLRLRPFTLLASPCIMPCSVPTLDSPDLSLSPKHTPTSHHASASRTIHGARWATLTGDCSVAQALLGPLIRSIHEATCSTLTPPNQEMGLVFVFCFCHFQV